MELKDVEGLRQHQALLSALKMTEKWTVRNVSLAAHQAKCHGQCTKAGQEEKWGFNFYAACL